MGHTGGDRTAGQDVLAVDGAPALALTDLLEVARWSGWGRRLPAAYTELGAELAPYTQEHDRAH